MNFQENTLVRTLEREKPKFSLNWCARFLKGIKDVEPERLPDESLSPLKNALSGKQGPGAVALDEDRLDRLCTALVSDRSNGVALAVEFLAEQLSGNLDKASEETLLLLAQILPKDVSIQEQEFRDVYATSRYSLQTRATQLGREVSLEIRAGQSVRSCFEEVERLFLEKYERDGVFCGVDGFYGKNGDVLERLQADPIYNRTCEHDTVVRFIILRESGNRQKFGLDPATSHQALLTQHKLDPVEDPYLLLSCAIFRFGHGFGHSSSDRHQGSVDTYYTGDLFSGNAVRGQIGVLKMLDDLNVVYSDGRETEPDREFADSQARANLLVAGRVAL